jgi:TatD DNase family protein
MFFDSHCHLHDEKFERDVERVIDRARAANVLRMLTLGDSVESSRRALALARRQPEVLAAVGIHPHNAHDADDAAFRHIEELLESPRAVAVGEIGLDYYHHHSGHEKQRAVFRRQLAMAREHRMPVAIHCREAYEDLFADLKAEKGSEIGGVCHCFSGTASDARRLVEMGFAIGVGGTCTYTKAEDVRDALRAVTISDVLLETDSPYLAPQSKRGRRNEPANIPIIARAVAELYGESYRDVARITSFNTERAFRLRKEHLPNAVYINQNMICVNLTNACTNHCEFCQRRGAGFLRGHHLRLEHEPEPVRVVEQIARTEYSCYPTVAFSGLGESMLRLDSVLEIARVAKNLGKRVVMETNGCGLLVHGDGLWEKVRGLIDEFHVSLNAHDQKTYNELCHPENPETAFPSMLEFIRAAREKGFLVTARTLDLPEVDLKKAHALARSLGVEHVIAHAEPVFEELPLH